MDRKTRLERIKSDFTASHASKYDTPLTYGVYFVVGDQSFLIGAGFDVEEANWLRERLATALDRVVKRVNRWRTK